MEDNLGNKTEKYQKRPIYLITREETWDNIKNLPSNYHSPDSCVEPTRDVLEVPEESETVEPRKSSVKTAGYTRLGGGSQAGETEERWSNNCRATGRDEGNSLQHDRTNPQITSENLSDSTQRGFSGRTPPSTALTGEYARRSWNGRQPDKTWGGLTRDRHDNHNQLTSYITIPSA